MCVTVLNELHWKYDYQLELHKAAAEVSRIGNVKERFVAVNDGWQSKSTDGSKGGWIVGLSICLSICLSN